MPDTLRLRPARVKTDHEPRSLGGAVGQGRLFLDVPSEERLTLTGATCKLTPLMAERKRPAGVKFAAELTLPTSRMPGRPQ